MAEKKKTPFKKHPLPKRVEEAYTPPPDKTEGTDVRERGYFPGANYTMEELAFIRAVDEFRKKSGRKFLSAVDHLRLALQIGYSKAVALPVRKPRRKRVEKPTGPTLYDLLPAEA